MDTGISHSPPEPLYVAWRQKRQVAGRIVRRRQMYGSRSAGIPPPLWRPVAMEGNRRHCISTQVRRCGLLQPLRGSEMEAREHKTARSRILSARRGVISILWSYAKKKPASADDLNSPVGNALAEAALAVKWLSDVRFCRASAVKLPHLNNRAFCTQADLLAPQPRPRPLLHALGSRSGPVRAPGNLVSLKWTALPLFLRALFIATL